MLSAFDGTDSDPGGSLLAFSAFEYSLTLKRPARALAAPPQRRSHTLSAPLMIPQGLLSSRCLRFIMFPFPQFPASLSERRSIRYGSYGLHAMLVSDTSTHSHAH